MPPEVKGPASEDFNRIYPNWLPNFSPDDQPLTLASFEGQAREEGFFYAQKPWKRAIILVAGVFMNLVLGVVAFTAVYTVMGIPEEKET